MLHGVDLAMNKQSEATARAFVDARHSGTALPSYPGERPATLADAYAVQSHAIAVDGRTILGWKVGRINPPLSETLGTTRLAGPIFSGSVRDANPAAPVPMPVFAGGFAAVEAEWLFRIDPAAFPDPAHADDAAILAATCAVHVGVEIASSPYAGINADGPLVTASDFGNNAGLVVGPEVAGWRTMDLARTEAWVEIDGVEVGRGTLDALPGGPIESVRFLLTHLEDQAIPVAGPIWISTGAISGVHQIAIGSSAVCHFTGGTSLSCRIIDARETLHAD